MKEIVIPGLYLMAGICAYAAVVHLGAGVRRLFDSVQITFAGTTALMLPFTFFLARGLAATDVGDYVQSLKWSLAVAFFTLALFAWFISFYTARRPQPSLLTLTSVFATLAAVNFVQPYSLQYAEIHGLAGMRLPWGETITVAQGRSITGAMPELSLS